MEELLGRSSSFLYLLSGAKFGMRDATQTKFEDSIWFPGAGGWRALGGLGQQFRGVHAVKTRELSMLYKENRPVPSMR